VPGLGTVGGLGMLRRGIKLLAFLLEDATLDLIVEIMVGARASGMLT